MKISKLHCAKAVCRLLVNKQAHRVGLFKFGQTNNVADYFIVANANSNTHLKALEEHLRQKLKNLGFVLRKPTEGRASEFWKIMDIGFLIVHLMRDQARERYQLETLWSQARRISWRDQAKTLLKKSKAS